MVKLALADEKMQAVLITNRSKTNTVEIWVGNHEIARKFIEEEDKILEITVYGK